jgi:hypothetical protein
MERMNFEIIFFFFLFCVYGSLIVNYSLHGQWFVIAYPFSITIFPPLHFTFPLTMDHYSCIFSHRKHGHNN